MTEPWWAPACDVSLGVGLLGIVLLSRGLKKGEKAQGPRRWLLLLSFFLLITPLFVYWLTNERMMSLVTRQEIAGGVFAGLIAYLLAQVPLRNLKRKDGTEFSPVRKAFVFLICVVVGIYGLILAKDGIEDVFLPPSAVHGRVMAVHRSWHGSRGSVHPAKIEIGGTWYYATTDIEPLLTIGTEVDAAAGAGSRYILVLTKPTSVEDRAGIISHAATPQN